MKKIALGLIVLAMFVSKPVFSAQAADTGSADPKFGTVDLARALNEVNEGKKAKTNLENEFKAKKKELDGLKNELASLLKELERKGPVLSQEAMAADRENYQRKFMEYQQKAKEYTEELARKEGEMTSKIIGKLRTVVEKIAQKEGYTFVFELSQGGVIYGPANADITTEVIKQYNK